MKTIKKKNKYSSAQGVVPYVANGPYDQISDNYVEADDDNDFLNLTGESCKMEKTSNIFGMGKKANERKMLRIKGNVDAKNTKANAKELEAQAKIEAAHAAQAGDEATAKAIMASAPPVPPTSTGMSTGMKIGIGAAIVGVTGFCVWYFGFRKKK